jgi:hypothetical protein
MDVVFILYFTFCPFETKTGEYVSFWTGNVFLTGQVICPRITKWGVC